MKEGKLKIHSCKCPAGIPAGNKHHEKVASRQCAALPWGYFNSTSLGNHNAVHAEGLSLQADAQVSQNNYTFFQS